MADVYLPTVEGFRKRLLLAAVAAAFIFAYFFTGVQVGSDCHTPYHHSFYSKRHISGPTHCDTRTTYRYGEESVTVTTKKTLPRVIRH